MKKKTAISVSLTVTTFLTTIQLFTTPAQANFGDFLLGVGATIGVGAIIEGNRADAERRYRPVPPEQEDFRGIQDGTNGAKYDNPRNSLDYERGEQEGLRRRRR